MFRCKHPREKLRVFSPEEITGHDEYDEFVEIRFICACDTILTKRYARLKKELPSCLSSSNPEGVTKSKRKEFFE